MSDLISRQAAIDAINDLPDCQNGYSDTYDKACIIGLIEELPSAKPEQKKGKWIDTDNYYMRWKCSLCGCHTRDARPDFCPYCGAKMETEE